MAHRNLYPYGNFLRYYESRSPDRWKDARLAVLPRELFEDKEVADIGCNDGTLTLLLAYHYNPVSVVGLDIDYRLINRAVEQWAVLERWHDYSSDADALLSEIATLPLSYRLLFQETGDLDALRQKKETSLGPKAPRFPGNVSFLVGNVLDTPLPGPFHTVLCLSTSKWIHLNWGDAGLHQLFTTVHSSLHTGGHFVFEPQPWSSYKKLKNQSLRMRSNYDAIEMKPEDFEAAIVALGFEVTGRGAPLQGKDKFKRPITIYRKV